MIDRIESALLKAAGALLLATGCGPVIKGTWDASGHTGIADAFDLDLKLDGDFKGSAQFATPDGKALSVPICESSLRENRVRFVIDTSGATSCATVKTPLTVTGAIGEDVIAGEIQNAAQDTVGIWRAYRVAAK